MVGHCSTGVVSTPNRAKKRWLALLCDVESLGAVWIIVPATEEFAENGVVSVRSPISLVVLVRNTSVVRTVSSLPSA